MDGLVTPDGGNQAALKMARDDSGTCSPGANQAALVDEIRALLAVGGNNNIVAVLGVVLSEEGGLHGVLQEYCSDSDLTCWMADLALTGCTLREFEFWSILLQVRPSCPLTCCLPLCPASCCLTCCLPLRPASLCRSLPAATRLLRCARLSDLDPILPSTQTFDQKLYADRTFSVRPLTPRTPCEIYPDYQRSCLGRVLRPLQQVRRCSLLPFGHST